MDILLWMSSPYLYLHLMTYITSLDLPKGAKWFLQGVISTTCLRVQLTPLRRCYSTSMTSTGSLSLLAHQKCWTLKWCLRQDVSPLQKSVLPTFETKCFWLISRQLYPPRPPRFQSCFLLPRVETGGQKKSNRTAWHVTHTSFNFGIWGQGCQSNLFLKVWIFCPSADCHSSFSKRQLAVFSDLILRYEWIIDIKWE